MYLRVTRRTNKDGSVVEYLQLAHNVRSPGSPHPHVQVIHNFGRKDQVDPEALRRLAHSLRRLEVGDADAELGVELTGPPGAGPADVYPGQWSTPMRVVAGLSDDGNSSNSSGVR